MRSTLLLTALVLAGCTDAVPYEARSVDRLTPDLAPVVEGNTALALDLYAQAAADSEDDLFLSPFSINSALSMTYAGAEGTTEEQMADVLHVSGDEGAWHAAFGALTQDLSGDLGRGYTLLIANRLFGQEEVVWDPSFLDVEDLDYGAPLETVDFEGDPDGSRQHINQWVADHTEDLIEELLAPGSIDTLTRLALANAIYFRADWLHPFDNRETEDGVFHAPSGDVTVPMMQQRRSWTAVDHEELTALRLPYVDEEVSMVVLLPVEEDGLADVEAALSPEALELWLTTDEQQDIDLSMPKFEVRSRLDLRQALSELGMPAAFDPAEADFTGMTDTLDLHISGVTHEAVVRVDELGTEAAAATGVTISAESMPRDLALDHPFLFLIVDDLTGTVLFMGRVVDPS